MASSVFCFFFFQRNRGGPSKTEMKMALVAKRIAMLDAQCHQLHYASPVGVENPRNYQSKASTESSDDDSLLVEMFPMSSPNRTKYGRHKQMRVISDDKSSEDETHIVKVEPRKRKRYKQLRTISDDESLEDKAPIVKFEPSRRKERAMVKKGQVEDSTDHEFGNRKKRKSRNRDFTDDFNVKSLVIKRAEEVQANLSDKYPSFVKPMLRSHVTQGFWLGLPVKFCGVHLPSCDCTMVLVDEDGLECDTKFLAQKTGLSAGWRGFSVEHKLREGDAVVFQLIKPTTFKVYIVRADSFGEVDGALGLLNLETHAGQSPSENPSEKAIDEENPQLLLEGNVQQGTSSSSSDVDDIDDIDTAADDGIHFSDTAVTFETAIESFSNFSIVVDGLVLDSKLSENVRRKYHDLCRSQGAFLHQDLLPGLNCNLTSGIISETVNIADAIKAKKNAGISSSDADDIHVWGKTLKGFEVLGMNVGFLSARVDLLLREGELIDESNRLREARLEQDRASKRLEALEGKLLEVKEKMKYLELELDAQVDASAKKRELLVKDTVNTPLAW